MKKVILCSTLLAVFSFVMIMGVSASSYISTLSLGQGKSVTGQTRQYTKGNYVVYVKINSFTKADGLDYTKLSVTKDSNYGNFSSLKTLISTVDRKTSYTYSFGADSQSNTKYTFSTKVGGYNYGGVTSNRVEMKS